MLGIARVKFLCVAFINKKLLLPASRSYLVHAPGDLNNSKFCFIFNVSSLFNGPIIKFGSFVEVVNKSIIVLRDIVVNYYRN